MPKRKIIPAKADLSVINHGSILILRAGTPVGNNWIDEHISSEAQTWCGGIVVEPRYIGAIVDGAQADGLTVEG